MTIHCIKQPHGVCVCARPPCGVVVSFSHVDIMGYFADALARGEPPDSYVLEYIWDESSSKLHAILFNRVSGAVSEYAMDIETRRPVWIKTIRIVPNKRKRPRKFGSAFWRATKAWEDH